MAKATAPVTPDLAEALLEKLDAGKALKGAETARVRDVVRALAATVAILDAQVADLSMTVEILRSEAEAVRARRSAALRALQALSPAAASVDADAALARTAELRERIATSASVAERTIAATRFAVGIAGKFI
ncbi:MAG: hypothetical protein WD749_00105 [Phycisphaerales bacterium]